MVRGTMLDAETIRSAEFWEEPECHEAGVPGGCVHFKTSGSSGAPKWIVLPKDALLLSARAVNEWLEVNAASVWGLALPMDHVGGFGVAARAYAAGCGLAGFEGKWDAGRFAEWVEAEGVTHTSLVPTQVHDLLAAGRKGGPKLRAVVVGGGRLSDEAGQAARDAGWPVLASYGMTEACSQVATQRMDAVGVPFVDAPLEILPIWDAAETAEGLLCLRGDALFAGIVEDGNFRRREGEWFTTSDRAAVSGRTIRLLGRVDSLVKVMGELVDVERVERRFMEVAAGRVKEGGFALLAMPDERREHTLVAVFEGNAVEECVADYNRGAPGPERIERWCGVAEFPRSELGKIRKVVLRQWVARDR